MRISDWSSDVCSSDLGGAGLDRDAKTRLEQALRGLHHRTAGSRYISDCRQAGNQQDHAGGHSQSLAQYRSARRSEEHTSELQSLMRISYAVFCLIKKRTRTNKTKTHNNSHSLINIEPNTHHPAYNARDILHT